MSDFNKIFSFYMKRRDAVLQINSNNELIKSSLSRCDISELDKQIKEDDNLRQLLYTPANELPEKYLFLLTETFPRISRFTLYDLIEFTIGYKDTVSYFSKAGNKIIGWCGYHISKRFNGVDEIKMFSFDLNRPNPVLLRDLKNLVDKLITEYSFVSWGAVPENPANQIYEQALLEYKNKGFDIKKTQDNKEIVYTIFNKHLDDISN